MTSDTAPHRPDSAARSHTPPRIGIKLAPQHTTVAALRGVWQVADEAGFDSCWNFDHFASIGSDDPSGDVFEGWSLLAAMAEGTRRVRIGCMVTGNTYRHPGVLAKMATTVDHLSGGRLEFGLGGAWAEVEHTMLGLEFGTVRERLDRLEEACQVIRSLWTQPTTTFHGTHYRLTDALSNPKPVQKPGPPLWIGGSGRKRTLRITAKYADAWNAAGGSVEELAELSAVLDQHCADVGRDPAAIRRTVQVRYADQPEELLTAVEAYARIGIGEVIVVLRGGDPVASAEEVARLLPRLRSIG
ncbi:LLM class F420-dependent oxidoreductase [Actinopolymorpha alba]|uniref:LLM class F420-dependent oxidoreductase n=1 Tax=Actinopolymorpha alba TaxID=533267 RepID=UPI0003811C87|nr:LLM class F420-dependent oxidoreductase [Actinopolymorpha alba]